MTAEEIFRKELAKRIRDGRVVLSKNFRLPSKERCAVMNTGSNHIYVVGHPHPSIFIRKLGNGGFLKVRKHP